MIQLQKTFECVPFGHAINECYISAEIFSEYKEAKKFADANNMRVIFCVAVWDTEEEYYLEAPFRFGTKKECTKKGNELKKEYQL